jgi:hypothetical protein
MVERSGEPRTRVTSFAEECSPRERHVPRGPGAWRSDGRSGRFATDPPVGEG